MGMAAMRVVAEAAAEEEDPFRSQASELRRVALEVEEVVVAAVELH